MSISDTQSAINAGLNLAEPQMAGNTPFVITADNACVDGLERFLNAPVRKRGTVTLRDAASFIKFVNDEKSCFDEGVVTRLFATTIPPTFTAIINDHGPQGAGWRDYVAKFNCPLSVEWTTWNKASKVPMSQSDFAQFIEDNLPDIASPPAAEMLEISRSLEAKKKVNFASGLRLSNGQNQLTYEEEISGTANKGQLNVPEIFTIGIPVFEGGASYAVEARLRYRITDKGVLSMWFELVRPHKTLEHAVNEIKALIQTETVIAILNGTPA